MRPVPNFEAEKGRFMGPVNHNAGAFQFRRQGCILFVIVGSDAGWDHVSVTVDDPMAKRFGNGQARNPSWDEMCFIKDIFFGEEEAVIQYHPPKSRYINNHPACLHLWRPQNAEEFSAANADLLEEAKLTGEPIPSYYPTECPPPLPLPPDWMVGVKELGVIA